MGENFCFHIKIFAVPFFFFFKIINSSFLLQTVHLSVVLKSRGGTSWVVIMKFFEPMNSQTFYNVLCYETWQKIVS